MRAVPTGWIDGPVTAFHVCGLITTRIGEIIRGTECDENITITTGTYAGTYEKRAAITGSDIRSTDDMAVDNLEIEGALQDTSGDSSSSSLIIDLSAADLEAGAFDNAEVTTFLVRSDDPDAYQHVLRSGWIGNTVREAEGRYKAEVRGLTQALSQGILRTYSLSCDAELGDERCKVDMSAFTSTDFVSAVISRREFTAAEPFFPGQEAGGKIRWLTGLNAGYSMEIKSIVGATVTLYLPMPRDITGGGVDVGDNFEYRAGCDKAKTTCKVTYSNLVNFRGHAIFVPGDNEILKVGRR